MAFFHLHMKIGYGAAALRRYQQLTGTGKYQNKGLLLHTSANLPKWALNEEEFWQVIGEHDKRSYREIEFALPEELDMEAHKDILKGFLKQGLPHSAYTAVISIKKSQVAKKELPYATVIFSERIINSETRSLNIDSFFPKNGSKQLGAIKDRYWTLSGNVAIREIRQLVEDLINDSYKKHGLNCKVTAKSKKRQLAELNGYEAPIRLPYPKWTSHLDEMIQVVEGKTDIDSIEDEQVKKRARRMMELAGKKKGLK